MNHPSTVPDPIPTTHNDSPEIEIFRAGDYGTRGTYTPTDLEHIARDYDPARLDAPLTLDHAQAGPAHGWITGLRCIGDRLLARLHGLGHAVRQLVATGAYRRCSIELLRRHPDTGRPYLRAVTLLGAATPAVHGLQPVRFSDDEPPVILPAPDTPAPTTSEDTTPTESGELRSALDTIASLRRRLLGMQRAQFASDTERLVHRLRLNGHPLAPDAGARIVAFARRFEPDPTPDTTSDTDTEGSSAANPSSPEALVTFSELLQLIEGCSPAHPRRCP
jgi:hypothetical protein